MTATVYVSAGESSGDQHGAAVIDALRERIPDLAVEGMGGPALQRSGVRVTQRMEALSVVGLAEVMSKVPAHAKHLFEAGTQFRKTEFDVAVLVDYPGFHMRLANAARRHDIPVLYFIAPQMWAWGARRLGTLRKCVNHLAVILPFEEPFFRQHDIPTTFVGHPLMDRPAGPENSSARQALGLSPGGPVLGVCPGSRAGEVQRLWPRFRDAARAVQDALPEVVVVVAGISGLEYPGAEEYLVHWDDSPSVMSAADAALCKSGTTTLEAALAGTPMVVAYAMHEVTYRLARRMVRCDRIALVNLLTPNRDIVPEFIQHRATPAALARVLIPLLDPVGRVAQRQRDGFEEVRRVLGPPGAAQRVSGIIEELIH